MTVEPNTASVRAATPTASVPTNKERRPSDWLAEPVAAEVLKALPGKSDRYVACAPGRLDVMGGLAEYSGSALLNMPVGGSVCVGVESVDSNTLSFTIGSSLNSTNNVSKPLVVAIDELFAADGSPIEPHQACKLIDPESDADAWCMLATILESWREGVMSRPRRGLAVAVGSTLCGLAGVAADAALTGATAAALIGTFDAKESEDGVLGVCRRVANEWLDLPIGVGDAHCVLHGEAGTVHKLRGNSPLLCESIHLSQGVTVVAIECGGAADDAKAKFIQARVAAFMGRSLIERIIRHENGADSGWDGTLSSVSVDDYVNRFRDRIPTKLKGSEYLERFGETGDTLTRIDPGHTYKIRSRTEHHIYESTRVSQFLDCLKRAGDGSSASNRAALDEAGEAMSASHWSYGQRCALGNVRADLLVRLLREHGTGRGVFGAKITGRGCGGVVVALVKSGPDADEAIDAAIRAFDAKTGRRATLLKRGPSGALVTGVRKV